MVRAICLLIVGWVLGCLVALDFASDGYATGTAYCETVQRPGETCKPAGRGDRGGPECRCTVQRGDKR